MQMIPTSPENIHANEFAGDRIPLPYDLGQEIRSCDMQDVENIFTHQQYFERVNEDESIPFKKSISNIVYRDCKLSGCNPECAKTHNMDTDNSSDTFVLLPPDEVMGTNGIFSQTTSLSKNIQPYTPDYDHCYSAPAPSAATAPAPATSTAPAKKELNEDQLVLKDVLAPPNSNNRESSEDEVDVVTLPEEYCQVPLIFEFPRKNTRPQRNVRKTQNRISKKNQLRTLNTFLDETCKTVVKRTNVKNIRRIYNRRKASNSVETTPSSSRQSSAQSSRCNSDVDDWDKRESHNFSERRRRLDQKTALQELRLEIPELKSELKASKLIILRKAHELAKFLLKDNQACEKTKLKCRETFKLLSRRVKQLIKEAYKMISH